MPHSFLSLRFSSSSVYLGFCLAAAPACTINNVDGKDGGTETVGSTGGTANANGGSSATTGGASVTSGGASAGDTGGASTGNTGGSSPAGGQGTAGSSATGSEPCSAADPGNNDRDHATAYTLGTDFLGCLQTTDDVDYYEFTTPATPVAGGVVVVSITNVGTTGNIESTTYSTSDNGEVQSDYTSNSGTSDFYWFNGAAATKYQVTVHHFTNATAATPYTFKVAYTPVNDTNEPNDQRTQSASMTVGTPVHGYQYAGYSMSTGFAANAWEDWFKVTLSAGTATITLADLASNINGQIDFYDSLGASVADNYSTTSGASVVLNRTGVTAGDYYVRVKPFTNPSTRGSGSVVPGYAIQPYTLSVTQ